MKKSKYIFEGNIWEFFFISLCLLILAGITFGLAFPFYVFWTVKYFINNTELHHIE